MKQTVLWQDYSNYILNWLGCDYCDKIRGIGPKSAIKLVQEHKTIENIIKHVDKKKHSIPENWLFEEARRLFKHPEVTPGEEIDFKWEKPDEEVRHATLQCEK